MSSAQKIVVTYTFVLDASVVNDDHVWNEIVKMEDERIQSGSNILPVDVTQLIEFHGGGTADEDLTEMVVNAIKADILEECPYCDEHKADVKFKTTLDGEDKMACEECHNWTIANEK